MTGKQSRVGFWANADKLNWSDFFHKLLLLLTRMRRRSKQPLQLPPPHSHGIISITPISGRLGGFGRKQAFYNFPSSSRYRATRHPTYPPQHSNSWNLDNLCTSVTKVCRQNLCIFNVNFLRLNSRLRKLLGF